MVTLRQHLALYWERIFALTNYYPLQMRFSAIFRIQYRMATVLWLASIAIEPVIYLVVWTTVAREQGGEIAGYTVSGFAAYYFTWTILRVINIGLHPGAFEGRVRHGYWSHILLRPIHPIHYDIAFLLGYKVIELLWLVPVLVVLYFAFHPAIHPTNWQIITFTLACIAGFFLRTIWQWALGMVTFWVVRVRAIFDLYFAIELLLSGRIVPLELLPTWAQKLANWLPYQWSFAFPIEVLIGRLSLRETVVGLGIQLLWIAVGWIITIWLWQKGTKKYSAVGA